MNQSFFILAFKRIYHFEAALSPVMGPAARLSAQTLLAVPAGNSTKLNCKQCNVKHYI